MSIKIDVVTDLNQASVREAAREAQLYFAKAGKDSGADWGDGFSKGLNGKTPEIQRAFDKATSASGKLLAEQAKLQEMEARGSATKAQLVVQSEKVADAYRKEESAISAANAVLRQHDEASRKAADTTKQLAEQQDRARAAYVGSNAAIQRATEATRNLQVEEARLQDLVRRGNSDRDTLLGQSRRVVDARRIEKDAVEAGGDAFRVLSSAMQDAASSSGELFASFAKLGPVGLGGLAVGVVAAGQAILQVGGIAASAAQSLLLLPAAAGAAGAAFGTLTLATLGFDDAIKDIRDPEKFAEDIRALSPNAQEAALAIQSLLPSFDQLKNATQDAFFSGVGNMLNQLANQYLPTIQNATTGIASAFNSMLQGATDQLMTPQTQASIQTFLNNVVTGFQNLAPAVAPLTKALADLMAVGSGFLPGLAQAATDAANSFSQFITQARQSGDLNKWISEGIATLKDLGSIAWDLGRAFMELAPLGRQALPLIVEMFRNMANVIPVIVEVLQPIGPTLGVIAAGVKASNDGFESMRGVVVNVANTIIPVINSIGQAVSNAMGPLRALIGGLNLLPGVNIPNIPTYTNINQLGGPGLGGAPGAQAERRGGPAALPGAGLGTGAARPTGQGLGSGFAYRPPVGEAGGWQPASASVGYTPSSGGGGGGGGGAAATPFVDPTKFTLGDPLAGMPAPIAGADQQAIFAADSKLITATHDLEQKKLALQVLEAKGNASQQELLTAKNDLQERERALDQARADDIAVRTGQLKKAGEGLREVQGVFATMDEDFGISGGLPGIAKFFTTLLGNFALAGAIRSSPTLQAAALSMQTTGAGGGLSGGYGGDGGGALGGYSPNVSAMLALAQGSSGGKYAAASDLVHGLSDCSGAVSDLYEVIKTGTTSPGRDFTTADFADPAQAAKLGFLPGYMPGALNVGVHQGGPGGGHMAATLPNGVNFESGGGTGQGATYGGRAAGALSPQFENQYYLPLANAMGPTPLGGGVGAPLPGAWGPGGMPSGGGMGGGPGAGGMGMPSALGSPYQGVGVGASNPQSMQPAASGGGGVGPGGLVDAAAGAAGALDMIAPGAGQAASVGIKLAGRAVQQMGQYAAIGVGGLMETFLPHDSPLAGNSWVSKIAGGIAGARPAQPNKAGQAQPPQPGAAAAQGPVTHDNSVNIANMSTEGKDGQGVANDIARYQAGGPR